MWTIIGQSGVMNNVVDFTASLAPLMWGLLGVFVLSAVGIVWTALQEHWAQKSTQQQEPTAEERKMAA